jgi:hypothetical protein
VPTNAKEQTGPGGSAGGPDAAQYIALFDFVADLDLYLSEMEIHTDETVAGANLGNAAAAIIAALSVTFSAPEQVAATHAFRFLTLRFDAPSEDEVRQAKADARMVLYARLTARLWC